MFQLVSLSAYPWVLAGFGGIVCFAAARIAIQRARRYFAAQVQAAALRMTDELRRHNARLDAALNHMSQGLCVFDAEQRLVFCNKRSADLFGVPIELMKPGMTLRRIMEYRVAAGAYSGTDPEEFIRERLRVAAENKPWKSVFELRDGRVIAMAHEPRDEGGWVATFEDITERLRAEGELKETYAALSRAKAELEAAVRRAQAAHDRLREAFDLVPEALVLFDAEDRHLLWNRQYEELNPHLRDRLSHDLRFEEVIRFSLSRGRYPEAIGREEEWLAERLRLHALPRSSHEQHLDGDRWIRVEERRTADGGSLGIRIDITELKRREASLKLLFENNPVPMLVCDRESLQFLAVNRAAVDHYGYSEAAFLSMSTLDIRPPEDRESLLKVTRTRGDDEQGRIWRHIKADGVLIDVAVYKRRLTYQGRPATLMAMVDLTERRRAEEEARRTRRFLDLIVENVPVSIVVKDPRDFSYLLINRAAEEFYGIPRSEIIGKSIYDIYSKETADRIAANHRRSIADGSFHFLDEHEVETPRNGIRLITARGGVLSEDGAPKYLLTVIEDVTERRRTEQRIAYLAHHDALTGLPNRVAFAEHLSAAFANAAASGGSFAVLCIDLDYFKETNDVFGHSAGDAVLVELGRRLRHAAGEAFLARVGGDEFMVISKQAERSSIQALIDRLFAAVGDAFLVGKQHLRIGMSIGAALYPSDGADETTLLGNADAALYRAKRDGRLTARFFEAKTDQRLREKNALQLELQLALENRQLSLHYQPQARIAGEIFGFEALIRWQHATRGPIPPGVFIPIAEEHGLISSIGEWVLREACREAASWSRPLQVAVNLSPIQLRHDDLPRLVHAILLETGLTPDRLELEITEGVLVQDPARVLSTLRRLKALGVKMAMDDFGTGYSSLSTLQSFPFDKIKIDQTFISNLDANPQSLAIVRAVVGLAHGLNIPVIAEGVETEQQRVLLARTDCDEVQGYLIGRPHPIEHYRVLTRGALAQRFPDGAQRSALAS